MKSNFSLFLFSTDIPLIQQAVRAGVEGVMIDWEVKGKQQRQAGADTQINHDTFQDLRQVRGKTSARIICRLNAYGPHTHEEVEQAIAGGADELFLPMVRSVQEVQAVLDQVAQRVGTGILIETVDAVEQAKAFAAMPLSRVYVGLNDLMIDRGLSNLFLPVADGTLERIRGFFKMPFGFGGMTLPDKGNPIPCRLLIDEMLRLDCDFSFLRRSFHQDILGRAVGHEIPRILSAVRESQELAAIEREKSHDQLVKIINGLSI